ncbi:MerR family transcriptional regulator [Angustibacter sp. McL0619]|uniref:MerR family transcriptional regulator n=1 Tax=Angustibacter sp. McL0619 TaxID=3415676 RepID=UPI003CF2F288
MSERRRQEEIGLPESSTLTVAAVARRLGVAPATLRTWARRYGLGPTDHLAGSHRRYSKTDLARLVVMRRLTHEGLSPAQAAEFALSGRSSEDLAVTELDVVGERLARAGGGRVVPLREASAAARGLARASMTLDAHGITEVLRRQVRTDGVVLTWESLVSPVLIGLGERYASTGEGVEVEHLFSECLTTVLHATTASLDQPRNTAQVLLACPSDEQHSLPLHAVSAALAERGVLVRQLGMRMPDGALLAAVRRSGPAIVMLYASMPVQSTEVLAELAKVRPAPRVLVGGPGWGRDVPPFVTRVESLSETVEEIIASIL